jgi:hypothetical protein
MRLVNFLREHPFSTTIRAKVETNFPGSIGTSRKRIKESELRNRSAANKIFLSEAIEEDRLRFTFQHTGCLMKNASTHNFFIYYPISMNKKIKYIYGFSSATKQPYFFFWRYLQLLTIVNFFF